MGPEFWGVAIVLLGLFLASEKRNLLLLPFYLVGIAMMSLGIVAIGSHVWHLMGG